MILGYRNWLANLSYRATSSSGARQRPQELNVGRLGPLIRMFRPSKQAMNGLRLMAIVERPRHLLLFDNQDPTSVIAVAVAVRKA